MNVVALSGGSASTGVDVLQQNGVEKLRLIPDNDEGGVKFGYNCLSGCRKHGMSCVIQCLPEQYNDPGELIQSEDADIKAILSGNEMLPGQYLAQGIMKYDEEFRKFDLNTPRGIESARRFLAEKAGKLSGHDIVDFANALPASIRPLIEEPKAVADLEGILTAEPVNARDLLNMDLSRPPMIIGHGFLPAFGYSMLASYTKIGKTTLATQMGISIVSGTPFLGFPIARQTNILYSHAENTMESMAALIRKQIENWGAPVANIEKLHLLEVRGLHLQSSSGIAYLKEKIEETAAELIIIDPISLFMGGDMNDIAVVRSLVKILHQISSEMHVSWLLIHHYAKPTVQKRQPIQAMLGSSGWGNFCESFCGMERYSERRSPDYKKLTFNFRLDRTPEDMCLYLNPVTRLFEVVESPEDIVAVPVDRVGEILRKYREPASYKLLKSLLQKEMGISEAKSARLIRAARDKGVISKSVGKYGKYTCEDVDSELETDINSL